MTYLRLSPRAIPLFTTLALSLLSLSFFFRSDSAFAATKSATDPRLKTICLKDFDPYSGRVIVKISSPPWWDISCGGPLKTNNLAMIETPPSTQVFICAPSLVPTNFIVTGQAFDIRCGWGLGISIVPIQSSMNTTFDVCASSPIPKNWVITTETRNITATCEVDASQALVDLTYPIQKTIGPVPDGTTTLTVCADSLIPTGFVDISNAVSDSCVLDHGNSLLIIQDNHTAVN